MPKISLINPSIALRKPFKPLNFHKNMAFAFGHLIAAWIVGLIIQKGSNKKLSKFAWSLLLFGGIFPDVDFLFGNYIHRTITHSLLFAIIIFITLYYTLKKYNLEKYSYLMPIGMLMHIFLDLFTGPGVQGLYPLSTWMSVYNTTQIIQIPGMSPKIPLAMMDMGMGFIWFVYLFAKNKLHL
jgi:membrane-bound metal-dependent hydrolase YbcI (DUF457 family)